MQYIIGTRGSKLALAQSEQICALLQKRYPMHSFIIRIISTHGDRNQQLALDQMNAKGIFVKEIEDALYQDEIHLAVHSMKDMPAQLPEGLCFTKTLLREDPRDVFVSRDHTPFSELPLHATIATGSKRRKAQLLQLRPDLNIVGIRGNIDTRLRKMQETQWAGIVLAAAGLHRLQLHEWITDYFSVEELVPACGQGALALEVREDNHALRKMINALANEQTEAEIRVERSFLAAVHGGCHAPVGGYCQIMDGSASLTAVYGNEAQFARITLSCPWEQMDALGERAADILLEKVG